MTQNFAVQRLSEFALQKLRKDGIEVILNTRCCPSVCCNKLYSSFMLVIERHG